MAALRTYDLHLCGHQTPRSLTLPSVTTESATEPLTVQIHYGTEELKVHSPSARLIALR
jgi:hypothetical protein